MTWAGRESAAVPPEIPVGYRVFMGSRILVADDEPHIRAVIRAYLERESYEVLEAPDGEVALELARTGGLDLLVLDVMLPLRSGFDILRTLRSEGSGVGVVMLTARDDVIDRVAGLELGADDYVTKPFEPREVVARVGAVLRRFGRSGPAAPVAAAARRVRPGSAARARHGAPAGHGALRSDDRSRRSRSHARRRGRAAHQNRAGSAGGAGLTAGACLDSRADR